MGGPIGLAITALSLLALKFLSVQREINLLNATKIQLTSKFGEQLKVLIPQLREAESKLARFRKKFGETSPQVEHQTDVVNGLKNALKAVRDAYTDTQQEAGKAAEKTSALTGDIADQVTEIKNRLLPALKLKAKFEEELLKLQEAESAGNKEAAGLIKKLTAEYHANVKKLEEATPAAKALAKQQKEVAETADEAAKAEEQLADQYRALIRELNPLQAESDSYAAKLKTLEDGHKGTAEELEVLRWQLDQYSLGMDDASIAADDFGKKGKDALKKVKEEADPMAIAFENAMKSMDDAGREMWRGFFDDGKFSIAGVKDLLKNLLAEGLHQSITAPLLSGLFGGGGSGGFQIPGLSSLFPSGIGSALNFGGSFLSGAGTQQAALLAEKTGAFGASGALSTSQALTGATLSSIAATTAAIAAPLALAHYIAENDPFNRGDFERNGQTGFDLSFSRNLGEQLGRYY